MMDSVQRAAMVKVAVSVRALDQCPTCGAVWNPQEVDPEYEETLDLLVERAQDLIDDDPDLDVFPDETSLRASLVAVIREAPEKRSCSH